MNNMKYWDKLKKPPATALKKITGGRLSGKSDINPQWRYQAMTELFGPCGEGWKYTIDKTWSEPASDGEVFAFATVSVQYKIGDTWSDPVQGLGGSMLIEKERSGMHSNDEAYKMAITDALGTALKMIGVAAEIYLGLNDTKYNKNEDRNSPSNDKLPF